jgi:hypothetical protein
MRAISASSDSTPSRSEMRRSIRSTIVISLFAQQVHLQLQMVTLIALRGHPVLLDEDERRDQHALERGDERQQTIRVGIETHPRRSSAFHAAQAVNRTT